ncbi:hypothetical protein ES332_A07G255100v1 [Gossypium tomentosum]|uniref:Uncharacterized protein n=1 Tax=Gossypium tomentosum TaxID=34277 RepID=A0A5D2PXU8_GOSTO|nr:hypothetical protein ES332_A07G255100v1 [Gossypium tomentosum]
MIVGSMKASCAKSFFFIIFFIYNLVIRPFNSKSCLVAVECAAKLWVMFLFFPCAPCCINTKQFPVF